MYGKRFSSDVLEATNSKALKLKSCDIMFKRYYPLQLNDMRRFDYKFSPIFDFFNEILPQLKTPDRDFPIVFDESLRGSYSKSNPLRQYMPNKPRKFGDLLYQTNDSDGFGLQAHLLKPEQFRKHKGLSDLVEKMLPSRFRNLRYSSTNTNISEGKHCSYLHHA